MDQTGERLLVPSGEKAAGAFHEQGSFLNCGQLRGMNLDRNY
jgi:hypothetical protein